MKNNGFPYGTLVVNVIGCFIIGLLAQYGESRGVFSNESRAFIFIGILGGFTTFSSFGNETFNLARDSQIMNALANVGANVVVVKKVGATVIDDDNDGVIVGG